jgi:hypothetical protein
MKVGEAPLASLCGASSSQNIYLANVFVNCLFGKIKIKIVC